MFGKHTLSAIAATVLFGTASADAQPSAPADAGAVSGAGTVVLKRRPDRMRIRVEVFARGKSMKEALASLKDRRDAVRAQLATLGAVKDSVAFDVPQVNASLMDNRRQMEMMIRSRMGNRAKKDAKKVQATPAVVSASLTAEWTLKAEDPEGLLLEAVQLQDAIKAADLAGIKDLEKASTDDEEMREELEGVEMNVNPGGNQAQPGTPSFVFVAKVPPADRSKAMAEAFAKAKEQASATASAAGAVLGPLRHVQSQVVAGAGGEDAEDPSQAYYRMMQAAQGNAMPDPAGDSGEARGSQAGVVSYRVMLVASFALK